MTDESLMLSVKNNDLGKAAVLYERYGKKLYSFFLYRNHGEKEKSNDEVQEVFFRLVHYRHSYKEGNNFRSWLYQIARNVQYKNHYSKIKREQAHENLSGNEEYHMINDDHQAVRDALKLLPESEREVLLMSKFLDLKYKEIAELQNCSESAVKVRVFRAMNALREVYFKIS